MKYLPIVLFNWILYYAYSQGKIPFSVALLTAGISIAGIYIASAIGSSNRKQ